MRIALFTETFLPKTDGIVTRLTRTIHHLARGGDEVAIVAPDGGVSDCEGMPIHGVRGFPLPVYPELKMATAGAGITRALERFRPHVVHVVNPAVLGACGIIHARRRALPLIASYHTHVPKYLHYYGFGAFEGVVWKLLRQAHNRARLNLCTSGDVMRELEAKGIRNCALWQRGVDTELFHPGAASEEVRRELTQGDPSSPLLLYVGRLSREKGLERLAEPLDAMPNAKLAMIGDGPHRAKLEAFFKDRPVTFTGYRKGQALAAAFASADVFLFPSETETLGLVLLEAMAAGCPVVAARAGGITDIVEDNVNGMLFEPGEPGGIARATQRLLESEADRRRLADAAHAEAQRWGWAAATDQLRGFYRGAMEVDVA